MLNETLEKTRRELRGFWQRVATTCYRRVDVYVRSLDGAPEKNSAPPCEVRLLQQEDLPAYYAMRPRRPRREPHERWLAGDSCMAVFHEGRIVHAGWIATSRVYIPYLDRELLLLPGDIYSHDTYTLPSYRSRGLGSQKGAHVFRHYRALGYKRSVVVVAIENRLGAGQVRALGYQKIGRYSFLRLGPAQHILMPFPSAAGRLI